MKNQNQFKKKLETLNRTISSKVIASVAENLPKKQIQDKMTALVNTTKHLKELTPNLLKLL